MKRIENVTIVGMGALGILYGDFFVKKMGKDHVTFVADAERVARFEKEGVYCNGEKCSFDMIEGGRQEPTDLLIFAVKGTALRESARLAEKSVAEDTVILSLLNGISSEEILAEFFGEQHLIYTVAQGMDATKIGNRLKFSNMGELRIGVPDADPQKKENLQRVMEFFDRMSLPYTEEEDIKKRMWSKWMLNVGCNQVIMVEEGSYRTIQEEGTGRERAESGHAGSNCRRPCRGRAVWGKKIWRGCTGSRRYPGPRWNAVHETGRTGKAVFGGRCVFWNQFWKRRRNTASMCRSTEN